MGLRINGLDDFERKLAEIEKQIPNARSTFLKQEAEILLGSVRDKSPVAKVDGGTLRGSWKRTQPNGGIIEVYNNARRGKEYYALDVEYGHRQKVGQFVPAIGKRLKKPFVPGQHFLRDAVSEVEPNFLNDAGDILEGLLK
ncbi:MAG: HK97 gp10 family phage protein [Schwartzia sp.]|nr:HK97 gp10 family phage protein [Schwartzia sp. (in: firmicutes)]